VFDDEDIPGLELETASAKGFEQFVRQRITRLDLICKWDGDEVKAFSRYEGQFLSPLRGWRLRRP